MILCEQFNNNDLNDKNNDDKFTLINIKEIDEEFIREKNYSLMEKLKKDIL